jgi:hypothetical protein
MPLIQQDQSLKSAYPPVSAALYLSSDTRDKAKQFRTDSTSKFP